MKNQAYRMAMLFDFYGDLLTERQREFYDLYYNEDLSLAEIAENYGISRQGVRDVIVRAEASMTDPDIAVLYEGVPVPGIADQLSISSLLHDL